MANLVCDDKKCRGRGIFYIEKRIFKIINKHNILNSEHNYVKNISPIDKKYFGIMNESGTSGFESYLKSENLKRAKVNEK